MKHGMEPRGNVEAPLSAAVHLPPLFEHLRNMRVLCPFAVSPAAYQAEAEGAVSCFCWFMAERHRAELPRNIEKQILAACLTPGAFGGCVIYHAVGEV